VGRRFSVEGERWRFAQERDLGTGTQGWHSMRFRSGSLVSGADDHALDGAGFDTPDHSSLETISLAKTNGGET